MRKNTYDCVTDSKVSERRLTRLEMHREREQRARSRRIECQAAPTEAFVAAIGRT